MADAFDVALLPKDMVIALVVKRPVSLVRALFLLPVL
jgi:hypothetical protein